MSSFGRAFYCGAMTILLFTTWLHLLSSNRVSAAPSRQSAFGGTVMIGDEIAGAAGPTPVNCTEAAYVNARPLLDAQRAAWISAATATLPGSVALGSWIPGPSGTPVDAPLVLAQPDGFAITITPVDLPANQGYNSGSAATGAPAFANVQINGSPSGCTMQDNAPKASPASGGDFYFNQLSNLRGLNAVRFTFSTPVQAFGAFFGDLETSLHGTSAFLRLFDSNNLLLADIPITSTIGLNGGSAAEDVQCSQTNTPGADVAAQGLWPGCGNATTRWIGFVATTPVATALVVVGDNDPLPGGQGLTEKLSLMGPTVVRSLPPAEVAIGKQAPATVTAGTPFYYTLTISNTSSSLAAGLVITDLAPAGVTFHAVTGSGCTLAADLVTCTIDTLSAGAMTTVRLLATAHVTATIHNSAYLTATNDTDHSNNQANVTVTPLAAAPLNYCAPATPPGNGSLVINELLYRQAADNDEWVELVATAPIAANTQFYLSDNDNVGGNTEYRYLLTIPAGGIPAGTYILIHSASGVNDTSTSDGDGLEFFGAGGGNAPYLNNSGDNITLYVGADTSGIVVDYVAYGSAAVVNGPGVGAFLPTAPATANISQSIASTQDGADTSTGVEWATAGNSGTLGPATPGAHNKGKTFCNVALTKTGPTTASVGAPFDYQIAVYNTAAVTMTGVVVSDTEPAGVTFNAVTGTGCNLAAGAFTCALGTLAPSASQVITVNATASVAQTITNTALTSALSDTLAADNQASHAIHFIAYGSIGDFIYLDLDGDGSQSSNETTPINGVPITLTLSSGDVLTTTSVDGVYLFPDLPPGVYTVTVGSAVGYQPTGSTTQVVTLGAGVAWVQADFGFAYSAVDLGLNKTGITPVALGATFPYTLEVRNLSATTAALDVVITDTQPGGVHFAAVGDPRCGLFAGQVTCNLGNLAPQAMTTVGITATAAVEGEWVNRAYLMATNVNLPMQSAVFTSTVFTNGTPMADLHLSKRLLEPANGQLHPGETALYALRIENRGNVSITSVTAVDHYDSRYLLYQSASITPTVQSNGILTWTLSAPNGTLPLLPGAVLTLTVEFMAIKP